MSQQTEPYENLRHSYTRWNPVGFQSAIGSSLRGSVSTNDEVCEDGVQGNLECRQVVDDETLLTLATEVEGLLNSRPFTHVSCVDPNDPEPLTSNHILIGRGNPNLSPDVFGSNDRCSRKRCRQAQFLTDHFWKRWLREYVPSLTERRKWKRSQPNVKPGDVVLVIDENAPRCQWNLGRVPQTFLWGDGQIRVPKFKQNEGQ